MADRPTTNFHEQCRKAVHDALKARLEECGLIGPRHISEIAEMDTLDTARINKPAVVVCYEGTEYEAGDGTNLRKDVGYPIFIGLVTVDPKSDPPGMSLTLFRQIVADLFSGQRLAGVPNVMFCNYNGQPEIFQDNVAGMADLRTAMTVTPIMRRLRSGA
jgi:hypothetical protein